MGKGFWVIVSLSKTHLDAQMIIIGKKLLFESPNVVEQR